MSTLKHSPLKSAIVMVACAGLLASALAQIPTIKITANSVPGTSTGRANCSGYTCASGSASPVLNYVRMTRFEVTGASNLSHNITVTGDPDSIRRRGNSTASGAKIPFRVKFDKRQNLFGNQSKSWALLANYYDPTFMHNAIAFELGKRLGLEFTPKYQFVKVETVMNGQTTQRGVYLLTPQISGNQYSVDVDRDFGGWLAELDYHCPGETSDCGRYFNADKYSIPVKIRYPEWGDDVTNVADFNFVKKDINDLVNKMSENGFPENGYRDYIDLESFAKYVLIQLFMDNGDWNGTLNSGMLGSNYIHRVDNTTRIKAGPLWDFDLSMGFSLMGAGGGGIWGGGGSTCPGTLNSFSSFYYTYYTCQTEPNHDFWKRLWADPVFKAKYKKAWDAYKPQFQDISAKYIDSVANLLGSSAAGNIFYNGMGGMMGGGGGDATHSNEQGYKTYTAALKTWWTNRLTYFDNAITQMNIDTSKDIDQGGVTPPTPGTNYTLTVNAGTGGTVSPSGASQRASGASVTVTATANSGYTFTNWTGAPSGANASANPITFNMPSGNVTLTANFSASGVNPPTGSGDTVKVEAESFTAKTGGANDVRISEPNSDGVISIGYINSGNTVTYDNVSVSSAGARTLVFRVASQNNISFSVSVNGTNAGTISSGGTSNWDTYTDVTLSSQVQLTQGNNTIVLTFNGAVNVDYFLLIGESSVTPPVSVKYSAPRAAGRAQAMIKTGVRGFTAMLPDNHGYTSYKLIDLRGRNIRSGSIDGGTTDLRFNNLEKGVLLLRLEGKNNVKTVLRATAL